MRFIKFFYTDPCVYFYYLYPIFIIFILHSTRKMIYIYFKYILNILSFYYSSSSRWYKRLAWDQITLERSAEDIVISWNLEDESVDFGTQKIVHGGGKRVMQPGVFMVILFTGVRSIYLDNIPAVIWNMRVRLILEPLRCLLSQLRAKQRGPIWKRQGQPGLCSLSALQQGVGGGTRTHGRINNATRTQRHGADLRVNEESETNGGKRMVIQVVKQERRRRKRM